ncbi:hypothetical protein DQ384_30720 [Sphaerisporangium album]|uniref:4-hydroxybenzoate decarboxylase n=1 Tax=Sphaerisporangium album TaxID=509200 RepID=A0A367F885_9ACTN|nr:non-oxidative hydroxyarylic acid decarboxylases subunit D [Sphaerisporangium album]RCG25887.1 hypothetical protein DQ384_30720 [Sphaerisporangium album]
MPEICPRCAHDTIDLLFASPVAEVWEVVRCARCQYCWRTSEPARRTERDAYPESFRMTAEAIANAPEVPSIPPSRVTP